MPEEAVDVREGQMRIEDADTDAMLPSGNMMPVLSEPLSPAEVQTLEHYERVIAQGIQTFVEVGQALMVIRDQRLYREHYGTFEDYLRQRWDLSRSYAHRMIDAAVVVENLLPLGNIVTVHGLTTAGTIVPANEAQARPLTTLPAEQQQEVWREAVETAPVSGVTAKHVQATVKRHRERTIPQSQKIPEPQTRRPARQEVQEGLIWGLREISDHDAWDILAWVWDMLNDKAEQYTNLRGMLVRLHRRFPDEFKPQKALEDEHGISQTTDVLDSEQRGG